MILISTPIPEYVALTISPVAMTLFPEPGNLKDKAIS
jgi:hypothetical protein